MKDFIKSMEGKFVSALLGCSLSDKLLRVFVLFILAGVALIRLKVPWWGLVLLMVGYLFIGIAMDRAGSIVEMRADSIYYMGFLFTLLALVVDSLLVNEGKPSVARFNIALTTTIFGLTARFVLSSFRDKSADPDNEFAPWFSQWSLALEEELKAVHDTLRESHELLGEDLEITRTSMTEMKSIVRRAQDEVNNHITALSDAMHGYRESLGSIDPQMDLRGELERSAAALSEAGNALAIDSRKLTDKLEAALLAAIFPIKKSLEDLDIREELLKGPVEESARALRENFDSIKARIDENLASLTQVTSALQVIHQELGEHQKVMTSDLETGVAEVVDGIKRNLDAVKIEPDSFSRKLDETIEPLKLHMVNLEEQFSANEESMTRVATGAENLVARIEQVVSDITIDGMTLSGYVQDELNTALTPVRDGLAVLADEFSGFRIDEEAFTRSIDSATAALREKLGAMTEGVEEHRERIAEVSDSVQDLNVELSKQKDTLNEALREGVADALGTLKQKLRDLDITSDVFADKVAEMIAPIGEHVHKLNKDFETNETQVHDISKAMGELTNNIVVASEAMRLDADVARGIGGLATNLTSALDGMVAANSMLVETYGQSQKSVEAMRQAGEGIQKLISEDVLAHDVRVASASQLIADQASKTQTALDGMRASVNTAQKGLVDSVVALKNLVSMA